VSTKRRENRSAAEASAMERSGGAVKGWGVIRNIPHFCLEGVDTLPEIDYSFVTGFFFLKREKFP